ncbi:uncharacterized protein PAC_06106 [Phialocephala subalpina]|uniref:Uncharacterized protein n=1 Tax=Phialocephala subalpina TaxID=576137 RepID=A0A1L7WTY0_9HELO|nr:uncharacterized protein PAC_06106 [Phialocephala subalpina]
MTKCYHRQKRSITIFYKRGSAQCNLARSSGEARRLQPSVDRFRQSFLGVSDSAARGYIRAAGGSWQTAIQNYASDPKPAPAATTGGQGPPSQDNATLVELGSPVSTTSESDSEDIPRREEIRRDGLREQVQQRDADSDIVLEDEEQSAHMEQEIPDLKSESEGDADNDSDDVDEYLEGADSDNDHNESLSPQGSSNVPSPSGTSGSGASTAASTPPSPQQTLPNTGTIGGASGDEPRDTSEEPAVVDDSDWGAISVRDIFQRGSAIGKDRDRHNNNRPGRPGQMGSQ